MTVFDCDGTQLGDSHDVRVAPVDHVSLVWTTYFESPMYQVSDREMAFLTGADVDASQGPLDLSVALWERGTAPKRLVDSSLSISTPIGSPVAWDELRIEDADPGTFEIEVTIGEERTSVPLVLTDHADLVAAINPPTVIHPMQEAIVCFAATYESREIPNAIWKWVVDGVQDPFRHAYGCRSLYTTSTSGTVVVTASAGGQSASVTLAIQP